MDAETTLADALRRCTDAAPAWQPLYDEVVARWRGAGVGAAAPAVGGRFQNFTLPGADGRPRTLGELLADGPIALSFVRGGWCPYCRGELAAWADAAPALRAAGGRLVVVSPEVGGRAERMRAAAGLDAELLCDVDGGVALRLGLALFAGEEMRRRYLAAGLDLTEAYGGGGWLLPVPATFALDAAGVVRFAHADPDFRRRAEPAEVIAALASIRH